MPDDARISSLAERCHGDIIWKFLAGHVDFKIDRDGVQESRIATTATMVAAKNRTDAMGHFGVFERRNDAI